MIADERPTRLVLADGRAHQLDVHTVSFDTSGGGTQVLPGGRTYRYPPEGLRSAGKIAGLDVRCVSAEVQMACHLGYQPTEKDLSDMALLAVRFELCLPPPYESTRQQRDA